MSRWLRTAFILLPLALAAQGVDTPGKAFFLHLGADRVDNGATGVAPLAEFGLPVCRFGHSCLGLFAGVTQWSRGSYGADEMRPGYLLRKQVGWAGLYGSGDFVTFGLATEYARADTYVVPSAGTGWYDEVTRNRPGAMGFVSLHGRGGFGGFVRAGSQGGAGLGLSLNF